jgi:predicted enzyme related to lactoylglutathione lyase
MAGITGLTGWVGIVLNAPDARALAYFYRDLFGWPLADDEPDWCTIRVPGAPANLAFQTEEIYERPTWPATSGKQQMMLHLDIGVSDLAAAVEDAVELGACLASHQPKTTCESYWTLLVTRSASTSTRKSARSSTPNRRGSKQLRPLRRARCGSRTGHGVHQPDRGLAR